jgi:hypothetical protein
MKSTWTAILELFFSLLPFKALALPSSLPSSLPPASPLSPFFLPLSLPRSLAPSLTYTHSPCLPPGLPPSLFPSLRLLKISISITISKSLTSIFTLISLSIHLPGYLSIYLLIYCLTLLTEFIFWQHLKRQIDAFVGIWTSWCKWYLAVPGVTGPIAMGAALLSRFFLIDEDPNSKLRSAKLPVDVTYIGGICEQKTKR